MTTQKIKRSIYRIPKRIGNGIVKTHIEDCLRHCPPKRNTSAVPLAVNRWKSYTFFYRLLFNENLCKKNYQYELYNIYEKLVFRIFTMIFIIIYILFILIHIHPSLCKIQMLPIFLIAYCCSTDRNANYVCEIRCKI